MRFWAYLLGALLVLATITGALAADTVDAHGLTMTSTSTGPITEGLEFVANKDCTLITVTKKSDAAYSSGASLRNGETHAIIVGPVAFVGDAATFNYNLTQGVHYVVTGEGLTATRRYDDNTGPYPVAGTNVNWTVGVSKGAEYPPTLPLTNNTDYAFGIVSITTRIGAAPNATKINTYSFNVTDLYNDTALSGVNVTFGVGCDNLTQASGIATVSNNTPGCGGLSGALSAVNLSLPLYTWNQTSYSIAVNGSNNATGYQARYNLSIYKLISGDLVNTPYNITTEGGKTYENGSLVYLLNGSNNVTFSKNTINATFYNLTREVNASNSSATATGNLTGAYDLLVVVRVQDANKVLLEENGTFNISINYTYNAYITNYTVAHDNASLNFTLERNLTYFFQADPYTYARNNQTLFINGSDPVYLYLLNLTLYRERTFNLSFLDEITRTLITGSIFELELISDVLAVNYSINDSQEAIELLTPAAYTLRWRSSEHPERDYYETISSESFFTIRLYSLTTGNSTDTLVKVINTQGQTIENATVSLLRYYVACNCYEVVEMAKTGFNGVAYMTSQEVEGHYKWIVELSLIHI